MTVPVGNEGNPVGAQVFGVASHGGSDGANGQKTLTKNERWDTHPYHGKHVAPFILSNLDWDRSQQCG